MAIDLSAVINAVGGGVFGNGNDAWTVGFLLGVACKRFLVGEDERFLERDISRVL